MTILPSGWASGPLSDFVTPRGKKVSPSHFPDQPFIGMDHVEAHTTKIIGSVPSRQMKSNASRFYKDDILYGRLRPYLNKVAQPAFDGLASGEFIVFEGSELIDPGFLRYRLHAQDFVNFASHLNEGDRPRVSFEQIGNFEILVPPPEEQRRIVERIEILFDEIDQGVESLRDAKKAVELYRQSLLKSAFEGRLTAAWRAKNADDLESADDLLLRIGEEHERRHRAALDEWQRAVAKWGVEGKRGRKPTKPRQMPSPLLVSPDAVDLLSQIPHEWGYTKLASLGELGRGRSTHRPRNDRQLFGGPYPFIQTAEVKAAGRSITKYRTTYSEAGLAQSKLWPEGTLCITIAANIAETAFLTFKACFPDSVVGFSAFDRIVMPAFVELFVKSTRSSIEEYAPATAQKNINLTTLESLVIPICSTAEQAEIVRILDAHLEATEALDAEVDASLARADALRQSILKKAFAGELALQDPTDEPASALLARIRLERDAEPSKRSRRRANP